MSSTPAIEPYGVAEAAGIHPLVLDVPFAVGAVNTFLIEDDPLTLVDCGPNTATELDHLEHLLHEHGHRLSDLQLIIVTHHHLDHAGLAGVLATRSGAEIACLDSLAPVLGDWPKHAARSDDYTFELMLRHGVETHVAEALRAVASITQGFGASASVTRPLMANDTVRLRDRRFTILHRPGHSQWDTLLHDEASGITFLGDHLLSHISSNALVDHPMSPSPDRRAEPLVDYRNSLIETRTLDISIGLSGHGGPVTGHRSLIDKRLQSQQRRAEHFYELLGDGPRSAHEMARMQWGDVAVTQAFLTVSEVLGHLGLLIADGRVREDDTSAVVRFEQAG